MTRSAHQRLEDEQRQLEHACSELVREFPALPEDEVKARFEEIVRGFEGAPVRAFVPVLAGRAARERLRALSG
jgi:hypothetical protein